MNKVIFAKRESIEQVEEGKVLAPKFDLANEKNYLLILNLTI